MRVLVTGAAGFIGRRVCALTDDEVEVVAAVRPGAQASVPDGAAEVVEADLAAPDLRLPSELDAIVHLAQDRVADSFDVTVSGTERLLKHARAAGASRFLLASTGTVYARSPRPLAEDAPIDASSEYARAKVAAELALAEGGDLLSAIALRIFTPYGPGQRDRLIARLIERVRSGEGVQVEGTRGLLLSPIHVDDIALAVGAALRLPPDPGFMALNVAAGEALGIREIAAAIGEAVGREPMIEELGGPEPGGLTADCSKLRSLLPELKPRPFAAGIRESV